MGELSFLTLYLAALGITLRSCWTHIWTARHTPFPKTFTHSLSWKDIHSFNECGHFWNG